MQDIKTDISLNGNQAKNIIIDQKDSFPPVSESYEGRKITLNGISYIFHNGAWQSVAEDLEGRNESHEEIFTFQPTANDLSVKDGFAKIKKIKGTSLLWNQIQSHKSTSFRMEKNNASNASSLEVIDDFVRFNFLKGTWAGVYTYAISGYPPNTLAVISARYRPHSALSINIGTYGNYSNISFTSDDIGKWCTKTAIFNVGESTTGGTNGRAIFARCYNSGQSDFVVDIDIESCICVSLASLGKGGFVPSTAEEFRALFPAETYPYNAGKLISFNASKLKTVGFNAFNGTEAKVFGGQTYYLNGEYSSLGFKESIDSEVIAFDLPADRLYTPVSNGYIVASGTNICINLSHSGFRNGEYLPYMDYNLSFDFIKSIKDSNNSLLFSDGELCSVGDVADEIYTISDKYYKAIKRIGKRAYQSGDENLENAITDKTNTVYILDTPIESEVFEKELSYFEWDFGTEEIIAEQEDENPIVPIRADVQYIFNAVDMIRNNYYLILEILKRLPKNITLDFWSLTQANAETSACEVTINNSNESIFPKVLATYGDYIHSRNIVVDLSNYSDAKSYVFDLFGDISNVPIGIRYSIFILGYNNSLKLDFPKQYLTNISAIHSPDGASEERYTIAYSSATKIDFIKLGDNKVWVDVSNKM